MANIFGGTEPPAWLSDLRKENEFKFGQLGNFAGTSIGAGLLANKERIPYDQAWREAKLNQSDPFWKLKAEQAKGQILTQAAQMEATHALAVERNAETRAWMEEAPTLAPWLSANPEKRREMTPPAVQSQKGMQLLEQINAKDQQYWNTKEVNRIREESSKLALEQSNRQLAYEDAYSVAPDEVKAATESLGEGRWNKDSQGKVIGPSGEATRILNQYRLANDMAPFWMNKDQATIFLQDKKAKAATGLQTQKDAGALERERIRVDAAIKKEQLRDENFYKHASTRLDNAKTLAEFKSDLSLDVQSAMLEKRQSAWEKPPIVTQQNGMTIIQHGPTIRVIKNTDPKSAYVREQTKLISKDIATLSAQARTAPKDETIRGQLADKQLELLRLFEKHNMKPTAVPSVQPQTAAEPNQSRVRKYNPATGELE